MARVTIVFCLLLAVVAAATSKKKNQSGLAGRIIGGTDIDITAVPYQVSVQYQKAHDCGGSLIGSKFVVTAAHCVYEVKTSDLSVRAGSSNHGSGGEIKKVIKVTMHPDFRDETLENDIAVLELSSPLSIGKKIGTILLSDMEPRVGEEVLLSGWGVLQENQKVSPKSLQSVKVRVTDKEMCKKIHQGRNPVTENMFCAGDLSGGKDACHGDSGGPAVVNRKLAGVVSWGVGCGHKNTPGVYTSVAKYKKWIQGITRST